MNILFISALTGNGHAGPTYSVPNQVVHLAAYDNVLWYNLTAAEREDWRSTGLFRNPFDFKFSLGRIEAAMKPIDLIVFEGFYAFHPGHVLFEILKSQIPYIIVPRCALTEGDQMKKRAKKKICNKLFYHYFARHALCIQYLTKKEQMDSGPLWNKNWFVSPNGARAVVDVKRDAILGRKGLECVYIGRIEPYQKGLDVLVDALAQAGDRLRSRGFHLSIYGTSINGSAEAIEEGLKEQKLDFVDVMPPVYGEEKNKVLMDADLFVLPSRYEGMPMGLLEALAFGLPCIVTPGTNMAPLIEEYGAGWVSNLDASSLADALADCCADVSILRSKGENAKKIACLFSWDSISEKWHNQVCEMIER